MSNSEIIPSQTFALVENSRVTTLLEQIRPIWQSRSLIKRVRRLLPVDPSSACQRLFNASIHDLREKIAVAGIDIAREAAKQNKLPPIDRSEDIEGYPTAKLIDLAYWIGLLSRPEWRKLHRVYEIRRDLEHEDDEYEAGVEDCIYIFKTCIDVVLSRDPIQLLRVTDVKEVVEQTGPISPSKRLLEDYEYAPKPRQEEICRFLVSTATNSKQPDMVRQNAFLLLRQLEPITQQQVKIELAMYIQERIGRKKLDLLYARVAYAVGALPYLKKAQLEDFFETFYQDMRIIGYNWRAYRQHGELLRNFQEVGGLVFCPAPVRGKILEWLVLAYIGEPGGYGTWGRYRRVFYSNTAAPIIQSLIKEASSLIREDLIALEKTKAIKLAIRDKFIGRRFQELVDVVEDRLSSP